MTPLGAIELLLDLRPRRLVLLSQIVFVLIALFFRHVLVSLYMWVVSQKTAEMMHELAPFVHWLTTQAH